MYTWVLEKDCEEVVETPPRSPLWRTCTLSLTALTGPQKHAGL